MKKNDRFLRDINLILGYVVMILMFCGIFKNIRMYGMTRKQFQQFLLSLMLTVSATVTLIRIYAGRWKRYCYRKSALGALDHTPLEQYQKDVRNYFEKLGYTVEFTSRTSLIELELICRKEDETVAVQLKRYRQTVLSADVEDAAETGKRYSADRCIVVSNSFFSDEAYALAGKEKVELFNRNGVNSFFKNFKQC